MTIDLDRCIGCSACVAACYIENNIPVVGEKEHLFGREMSWIRIEQHNDADGRSNFVPMLCQHCGSAPCEPVCPVFAAYHTAEGLNAQIYNRCVGTRYCANNCPFKARRFNWFDHDWPAPMDKMLNPDISVRTKGIMEKCTFCVQRIRVAKDAAKDEMKKVRDGELVPACAQTCPTGAIVFGNLLDHDSRVYELAHSKRAYRVFDDLGVESAIHYLSKPHRTTEA
jgi:molybdopterin-containing oxidoreductase family iron-sulfur binding subunit